MDGLGKCGRFELERPIGAGGMGEIFLARDPEGGRVAIKRLLSECANDPVFIGMFLDEARLVERLRHPNVCEVFEHGLEGQHYFLAMEHVDGLSLEELLERRGHQGLPFPLACRIVAEVASALDYAHRAEDDMGRPLGLVHRDVSPSNVLLSRHGEVKLADFGIAKATMLSENTAASIRRGKYAYMSPEQIAGEPLSSRSDQFGFGVMLHELLLGRRPFDGPSPIDTMDRIREAAPPDLGGLDADLAAIVGTCLAKLPDERFETAEALQRALTAARRLRDAASTLDLARWVSARLDGDAEPSSESRRTITETATG